MRDRDVARFWRNVDRRGTSECWPWTGTIKHGYGYLSIDAQNHRSHRLAWIIANGAIPSESCVCHSCDNRRCVNPAHLWLGTNSDNLDDMRAKGRGTNPNLPGEANPNAKLTRQAVIEIRQRAARGESSRTIAPDYGIGHRYVCKIVSKERWAHV